MEFDVILRGGDVLDGTGAAARRADVGVRSGRIAAVADLTVADAPDVVDASGCVVAPGFIDVHAHTDLAGLLDDAHSDVKTAGIRQGVTTEVCGNCGFSPFPALTDEVDPADPYLGLLPEASRRYYRSLADFRDAMAEVPLVANLAPLLGHGRIRSVVVGGDDRPPTSDELADMRRLTHEAMEDGAFGLSSGLIYAPAVFADTEELIALAAIAGRYGRPYTTHMRDEADHVEAALDEALRIGREAKAAIEISHHKIAGRRNWGRSQQTLAMVENARQSGLDVTIDVYPYTAGSTFLAALLPPWVLDGGPGPMLERLRDRQARRRIERNYRTGLPGWQNLVGLAGWDSVIVAGEPPRAGRSIAVLADGSGTTELDYVADLLIEDPRTIVIIHMMDEDEVEQIGDQPFAIVGSDGVPIPGSQHPRLAGTFARVLRRHRGDADRLADAVRRMTSLAAERFRLTDRGVVAEGKAADLVVFDRDRVADRATYEHPLLSPVGIHDVLIAGEFVVRGGRLTGARPGTVLEPA